ncbi:DNA modification methylase [Ignavibacterium album JCM 16511]|uniref:Methyltransferase n=1 Tax=Ignavibacterium album (strain DSM 19864 / JCM 16511 / NBRC 101810 / Mat9-16) TaxID=945713 RepID=I0AH80_IGNAJ|nr:DNA methyltransferase [Ignavibacterium album]AFH48337.1 DNA modification methylase [Ignavibacterium album JCM 16511]
MLKIESQDYKNRTYLSAIEAAKYLSISVDTLHSLVSNNIIKTKIAASGQMRFELAELIEFEKKNSNSIPIRDLEIAESNQIEINGSVQKIYIRNSMQMNNLPDESIHLMITSPPYFNAKMYSKKPAPYDLGNIHDLDEWFEKINKVWSEVYRVLQPGRKAFINIMNLPIRLKNGGFRTLNLVGRTIDNLEKIGFIFKRDIVWHKTNAVRAHFGTYPYPGGILINNMHEFILEFDKPERKGFNKYSHLSKELKEKSKLDKEFWLTLKKSDVWLIKPQGSGDKRSHIAPFPYELPYRLIKAFSFISETVLDPFVGSGTSLLAAADLKRNGIGFEINKDIAYTALKALQSYQSKLFEK